MKPFLLMAGDNYYPSGGSQDWIGCYETLEEAQAQVSRIEENQVVTIGKSKGQINVIWHYEIVGKTGKFDWYEVEDLRSWINK